MKMSTKREAKTGKKKKKKRFDILHGFLRLVFFFLDSFVSLFFHFPKLQVCTFDMSSWLTLLAPGRNLDAEPRHKHNKVQTRQSQ